MTRAYTRNGRQILIGSSRSASRSGGSVSASALPGIGGVSVQGHHPSTADPAVLWGMGGNVATSYDYEDIPWLNIAHSSRGWIDRRSGSFVNVSDTQGNLQTGDGAGDRLFFLWSDGTYGYPVSYRGGTFRLTYDGTATVSSIENTTGLTQNGTNDYTFTRSGTAGNCWINFTGINYADKPRNIRCIRTDLQTLYDSGEIFDPDWVAGLENLGCIRNLNLMQINDSTVTGLANDPQETWQNWRAMPLTAFIKLCNKIGCDAWVCFPHLADTALQDSWLTQLRDDLGPTQRVYVEYSNEIWNFGFDQTGWIYDTAAAEWSTTDAKRLWNYKAKKSTELAVRARAIFGSTTRLCMVMATQTVNPQSALLLDAAIWQEKEPANYIHPETMHDAWAITTYFGNYRGNTDPGDNRSAFAGYEGDYPGYLAAVMSYLDTKIAAWQTRLAENQNIANTRGLDLLCYEANHHFDQEPSGVGAWYEPFHEAAVHSAEMAQRVTGVYDDFVAAGGKQLCVYRYGGSGRFSSGSCWSMQRYRGDTSPLLAAVDQWAIDNPKWW